MRENEDKTHDDGDRYKELNTDLGKWGEIVGTRWRSAGGVYK